MNTTTRAILVVITVVVGVPALLVFVLPERVLDRVRAQLRHPKWPLRLCTLLITGKMPPLYDQSSIVNLLHENITTQVRARMNESVPPMITIRVVSDFISVSYYWALENREHRQRVRLETCLHCCVLACMEPLANGSYLKAVYESVLATGVVYSLAIRQESDHWRGSYGRGTEPHYCRPHPTDCDMHKAR